MVCFKKKKLFWDWNKIALSGTGRKNILKALYAWIKLVCNVATICREKKLLPKKSIDSPPPSPFKLNGWSLIEKKVTFRLVIDNNSPQDEYGCRCIHTWHFQSFLQRYHKGIAKVSQKTIYTSLTSAPLLDKCY